jgi:hypothetical protein
VNTINAESSTASTSTPACYVVAPAWAQWFFFPFMDNWYTYFNNNVQSLDLFWTCIHRKMEYVYFK